MGSKLKLGTVLHLSNCSGNLILKAERKIRIGDKVFDDDGKKIGIVFDLFGPVSNPFVAVKPRIGDAGRYIGGSLFLRKGNH